MSLPAEHSVDPATSGCSCGSDHDHGPTGAQIVHSLGRGFAIVAIVVPATALALSALALIATPSSLLVPVFGLILGLGQVLVLAALSAVANKTGSSTAASPGFLAARVCAEEILRLAVVLSALLLMPDDARGPIGLWIGVGAMLVWAALTTSHLVSARSRILRPGEWSKTTVLAMLDGQLSVARTMRLRYLDIVAVFIFQLAATTVVAFAPIMILAVFILALASGFSTLVLQRLTPERRQHSLWAYAPLAISLLLAGLVGLIGLGILA